MAKLVEIERGYFRCTVEGCNRFAQFRLPRLRCWSRRAWKFGVERICRHHAWLIRNGFDKALQATKEKT